MTASSNHQEKNVFEDIAIGVFFATIVMTICSLSIWLIPMPYLDCLLPGLIILLFGSVFRSTLTDFQKRAAKKEQEHLPVIFCSCLISILIVFAIPYYQDFVITYADRYALIYLPLAILLGFFVDSLTEDVDE